MTRDRWRHRPEAERSGRSRLDARALALGAGTALYLVGAAVFRRTLGIGRSGFRTGAGIVALASVPLGLFVGALLQLAFLVALLAVTILLDRRRDLARR